MRSCFLRVLTLCSGLESPIMALERGHFLFDHVGSCECDHACEKLIKQNFSPQQFWKYTCDLINDAPDHDSLIAGPPCEPWSSNGLNLGYGDQRSNPLVDIFTIIEKKKPDTFLLEEVEGFVKGKNFTVFVDYIQALQQIDGGIYNVHCKVLDAKYLYVPQSRPRIYIVGIKKTKLQRPFAWPVMASDIARTIDDLLDNDLGHCRRRPQASQTTAIKNVNRAFKLIKEKGGNPDVDTWVIDCDSTDVNFQLNLSPCLTKTRGGMGGYWLSNRGRRMKIYIDIARIQNTQGISQQQLGRMVGNAMNVQVIQLIMDEMRIAAPGIFRP